MAICKFTGSCENKYFVYHLLIVLHFYESNITGLYPRVIIKSDPFPGCSFATKARWLPGPRNTQTFSSVSWSCWVNDADHDNNAIADTDNKGDADDNALYFPDGIFSATFHFISGSWST